MKRIVTCLVSAFVVAVLFSFLVPPSPSDPAPTTLDRAVGIAAGTVLWFVVLIVLNWIRDGISATIRKMKGKTSGA
jgi:hypothetical protein